MKNIKAILTLAFVMASGLSLTSCESEGNSAAAAKRDSSKQEFDVFVHDISPSERTIEYKEKHLSREEDSAIGGSIW